MPFWFRTSWLRRWLLGKLLTEAEKRDLQLAAQKHMIWASRMAIIQNSGDVAANIAEHNQLYRRLRADQGAEQEELSA
ncbi:MAG: hypothetical protein QNJ62_05100 [Methyloceanibacter sp.]|nr:hypothetical protein [Methyloceanibacter sp.]